jgi:glycosyltransferase involved in cell wall biosynthesis
MRWLIATPFSKSASDTPWLGRFVQGAQHRFEAVPGHYDHDRSRSRTDAAGWLDYLRHAWRTWRAVPGAGAPVGVITCFPQLPAALGLLCSVRHRKTPIIAWSFNLGSLPSGIKRRFARWGLGRVNLFVVHSRAEIESCSRWLALDKERFVFVPLQCPRRERTVPENDDSPYVLAMGTANRDYASLFDAVRALGMRTIVVAGPHAVQHLDKPENVELMSGLSGEQCHELLQGCRVSVIPVANAQTASGQVTLLDSLAFGRATIVTDCPGSADYIVDGVTALAVRPGDRLHLQEAIGRLWEDAALRHRLSAAALADSRERFSDEAVAKRLAEICDDIEMGRRVGATP